MSPNGGRERESIDAVLAGYDAELRELARTAILAPAADGDEARSRVLSAHEEAKGVLERKMGNVGKTGAKILATECPACMMHLGYGVRRRGLPIEVRHVSQVLDEAQSAAPH